MVQSWDSGDLAASLVARGKNKARLVLTARSTANDPTAEKMSNELADRLVQILGIVSSVEGERDAAWNGDTYRVTVRLTFN